MILYAIKDKATGKYLGIPRRDWKQQGGCDRDRASVYTSASVAQRMASIQDPDFKQYVIVRWTIHEEEM